VRVLLILLLIAEPLLILRRYIKSEKNGSVIGFVLNPLLYFLVLSYLYFLVPAAFLDIYIEVFGFHFLEGDIYIIRILYVYYNILFLLIFCLSSDNAIKIRHSFLSINLQIFMKIYLFFLTVLLIYVLFTEFANINMLREDRGAAFSYYTSNVHFKYKISFVNINVIVLSLLLAINSINKNWFVYLLPYIPIILLDYSHGGRAISFSVAVAFAILLTIKNNRLPIKKMIIFFSLMIFMGYLQRSGGSIEPLFSILMALGEFFSTGVTPLIVLKHNIAFQFSELLLRIILSLLPGIVKAAFNDVNTSYINTIEEAAGLGYGLAGNLLSEALVYGGMIFALISPIIICLILYFINKTFLKKKLIGFLFIILILCSSQNIIRFSFYESILPILYTIAVWLFYLFPKLSKNIIIRRNDCYNNIYNI